MTQPFWLDMILLLGLWLAYFALHSLLASLAMKRRIASAIPQWMPLYRLCFNLLAVLLLLPILWLLYSNPGPVLWRWQGIGAWLANALALAALAGFWHSLKYYDTQEFLGFRQWKLQLQKAEDQERFRLSPFHRFVRHPWYFFGLVLIWTRDMNAAMLLSSVMMTAYFIVGSRLEEKKLLVYHGEVYRRYMNRVAGLVPLPWKVLSPAEADELAASARAEPNRAG